MSSQRSQERAPVAIVIVTRNSAAFLEGCLQSIRGLERIPEEVVIADSGSSDGTPAIARRSYPEAQVIEFPTNVGFCRANNVGIARTRSPFVLVLNPDTKLSTNFVEELLPAFDDPRVGLAAGKLFRFDGRTLDSAGQQLGRSRRPVDRGYGRPDRGKFERDEEVFSACGAAALYRRSMLDLVADAPGEFFDEAFFAFYEDLDLAWRARHLGFRAEYRHRAVGFHLRGGTTEQGRSARRFRALASRDADLRYHIAKNRYLTILRNDMPGAYLKDAPFILSRDLAMLGILLLTSPAVLLRLWRSRDLFRRALERRRLDSRRAGHHFPTGPGLDPGGGSVRPRPGSPPAGTS